MEDHHSVHAPIPGLGLRSIKTAIAVMLTALLYAIPLFGGNPTFACIGAIFGMGADMEESRRSGGNRFFGTIIGGFIGMFLYWLEHLFFPEGSYWLRLPLTFLGIIVMICLCVFFHWPGGVQPGGVVLCIILFSTPAHHIGYALHRMVDTGIGVAIALLLNYLLPRSLIERWFHLKPAAHRKGTPLLVNGLKYSIVTLLGHGKGGYSYLAERNHQQVVLKQIHHEPCDYYTFGNKIAAEQLDYEKLLAAGIRMPKMLDIDTNTERVVKEYVEGDTIFEMVKNNISIAPYLEQVREMAAQAKAAGLNIDYFPTNFIVQNGLLYYIDYECNDYMDQWSFENWGIKYWSRTPEFEEYLRSHRQ